MGKLRTAIQGIVKSLDSNAAKVNELDKQIKDSREKLKGVALTAYEGLDAIAVYLSAKFKKSGTKLDDHKKKKLKDDGVWDSELEKLVKGVASWRKGLLESFHKGTNEFYAQVGDITKTLDTAAAEIATAKKIADKKRAKWLTSKDYKAKINTYLAELAALENMVKQQRSTVNKAAGSVGNPDWINKNFGLDLNSTVDDVKSMVSMGLNGQLAAYYKDSDQRDAYVVKWRDEYKGIARQLATMKKWSDDADEMDALTDL